MNTLPNAERVRVVQALLEGNSILSTSRITGVARNTVTKLLIGLGAGCMTYHHRHVRNVRVRRLKCDQIWAHAGVQAQNVSAVNNEIAWRDVWTWVGIDADTKLVVSYLVGGRGAEWAMKFMKDAVARIQGPVQITMHSNEEYLTVMEQGFRADMDSTQLEKLYGSSLGTDTAYSPVTRQNLASPVHRFTRLKDTFSKKIENHACAVAFHFMYWNYVRIHQTVRVTPAMEAGLCEHRWTIEELLAMGDEAMGKR